MPADNRDSAKHHAAGDAPPVAIILVNWNRWADTIECLDSLLGGNYPSQRIIVVDNGSRDDSVARISAWARGASLNYSSADLPGVAKRGSRGQPVSFAQVASDEALLGWESESHPNLVLIDAGRNHGFAGGVNIGLRYALRHSEAEYFWILNNDTVVTSDCLSNMVGRLRSTSSAGVCGSRILFYSQPDIVQVLGGARFRWWSGTSHLIEANTRVSKAVCPETVERQLDHISGASMLVTRAFLRDVGLLSEDYFLYYEEVDWAMRGKDRHRLVYSDDAIVYHKEGASIGSSHQRAKMSELSAYFLVRNRIRFTRKFFPYALVTVFGYSLLVAARDWLQGNRSQAAAMLAALFGRSPKDAINWSPD